MMHFVNEYIPVGVILKPYKHNGFMLARIDAAFMNDVARTKALFLKVDGLQVPFFMESFEAEEDNCMIKLEEFNAPETIRKWNGEPIFLHVNDVSKDSLELQKHASMDFLQGFTIVENASSKRFIITMIEEYPQQLMATIMIDGNPVLIPLVDEWITDIDETSKLVFMDLPEGLI
jgi:16S rRNA processing protein RimM